MRPGSNDAGSSRITSRGLGKNRIAVLRFTPQFRRRTRCLAPADNGVRFAARTRNRGGVALRIMQFDLVCEANGIARRPTKPNHPWTNGRVERINRAIEDTTVKRYRYHGHDRLRGHLSDFRPGSIHRRSHPPEAGTEQLSHLSRRPYRRGHPNTRSMPFPRL